jgi:glucokinase
MAHVIGVDLGGTKIAGVVYDTETQKVVNQKTIPTEAHNGPDAVIERIASLTRDLSDSKESTEKIYAVGVGVPGVIDYDEGLIMMIPNLPGDWDRKPIESDLEKLLDMPVWLINDARAFTLAEANIGAGKGSPIVACFTLGTGIGGGIAINGEILLGVDGAAGEFGHMCIDFNGLPDGSGTPGGMESFGSGPAITALGAKAVIQGVTTKIGELVDFDVNKITPRIVMEAAQDGDDLAKSILDYAGKCIGVGIANVLTILNPHCVVLGGGVLHLGDWIMNPLREALKQYSNAANVDRLKLVKAELGDDAGAIGAALWAYQRTNAK